MFVFDKPGMRTVWFPSCFCGRGMCTVGVINHFFYNLQSYEDGLD